jgi:hypothetical protein
MLTIRLLGELAVLRNGEPLALPSSKKTRALLAYLVATGRPHERNRDDPLGPYEPPSLGDVGFRVIEERAALHAPKQEEEKPKLPSGLPL